jgi:hypothetical protein
MVEEAEGAVELELMLDGMVAVVHMIIIQEI